MILLPIYSGLRKYFPFNFDNITPGLIMDGIPDFYFMLGQVIDVENFLSVRLLYIYISTRINYAEQFTHFNVTF